MLQAAGLAAAAPGFTIAQSKGNRRNWPIEEGPDTPKLCLGVAGEMNPLELKRVKQVGVNYVLSGGPRIPWTEDVLRERMNRCKEAGITLYNLMIGGFTNTLYGRPGRDEEIEKVVQSIKAAGKAGLAVVEYNFYAHRAVEGYYGETGRGGSGLTAFDFEKMRNLPPLPEEGINKLEAMWANIGYFLKAVAPAAKEAGVKLALHPNDPPLL